jgi:hypothetical protein
MQEGRARSPAFGRHAYLWEMDARREGLIGDQALHIACTFCFVIYPEVEHEFSTERDYSSDGDTCDF